MSEPAPQAQQTQTSSVAGQQVDASNGVSPAPTGGAGTKFTTSGPIPPVATGAAGGDGGNGPSASDQAFGSAGAGVRMRVTATGLNVRLTPDSGSKTNIIGALHHGEEVEAFGHAGVW